MQQKKFRLTFKAAAWECSIIFFALPFLGVSLFGGILVKEIIRNNEIGAIGIALSLFFGSAALIIGIIYLSLVFGAIGRAIFSYLLLSDQGLEYRLWPLHKIRCNWEDVEQIKKSALPFQGEILMLKKADVSGFQRLLNFNKGEFGAIKIRPLIPLYQINGWKNGQLKNEMKKCAPNLFDEQSITNAEMDMK